MKIKISETLKYSIQVKGKCAARVYIRLNFNKKYNEIFRLKVNKDQRRLGLATKLMKRLIREHGKSDLLLRACPQEDSISLAALMGFYSKFGFIQKNNSQTMIREGTVHALKSLYDPNR